MAQKKKRSRCGEIGAKNLQPLNTIDPERAREIRRKGAEATNRLMRQRKSMKENMNLLLSLPAMSGTKLKQEARNMGIEEKDVDNQTIMLLALFKKALKGDVAACKEVRAVVGELFPLEEESSLPDNNITIRLEFPDNYNE